MIGVTGGSGSGKTTFARDLMAQVDDQGRVLLISQDAYYLEAHPCHLRMKGELNFDHPEAFDWDLLQEHLQKLKNHKPIELPIYDFKMSRRTERVRRVHSPEVVILEGPFVFWNLEIRSQLNLKIFLQVADDLRFIRRLYRDIQEKRRTLENIIRQYQDVVRPMHALYVEPARQYADFVVGEETEVALSVVVAKINQVLEIAKMGRTHLASFVEEDPVPILPVTGRIGSVSANSAIFEP